MNIAPFCWKALWYKTKGNPKFFKPIARLLHMSLVQAAWWLDDAWIKEWKHATYQGPVFILGHQRSGTTMAHRAMTKSRQAVGATLAQMIMPAISLWRSGQAGLNLDAYWGGHVADWVRKKETAAFSTLEDMHHTRFGEVEEDEFFFWTLFASGMCANDSASSMDNRALDFLRHPEEWSANRRQLVWTWYEACLRKLAYFAYNTGSVELRPWVVAKNPALSSRIPELLSIFPNARFIVLHRNPCRAIASRLCLIQQIWAAKKEGAVLRPRHVELIYQDSLKTYRSLERDVPSIPASRRLELSTNLLKKDPDTALGLIERKFGIKITTPPSIPSRKRERHLEEFGLTTSRVHGDLSTMFNQRAWDAA